MSDSRDDLTKIHLESLDAWASSKKALMDAATESLDLAAVSSDASHAREAAAAHLTQWVESIFETAMPNVTLDGRSLAELSAQETLPFDEVLDRRIWSLSEERIAWEKTLADRRRTVPLQIESLIQDLLKRQREAETVLPPPSDPEALMIPEDEDLLPRLNEMSSAIEVTKLEQTLPTLIDRSQRAHRIIQEVKGVEAAANR